jgi:hypothetical protein
LHSQQADFSLVLLTGHDVASIAIGRCRNAMHLSTCSLMLTPLDGRPAGSASLKCKIIFAELDTGVVSESIDIQHSHAGLRYRNRSAFSHYHITRA